MNLSRKNKKNVNKKFSKKLTTKPKKKLSKKSIIKSRKKITRKSKKKYNKNKLKFNKINGGTLRSRISLPRISLSRMLSRRRSQIGQSNSPVIGSHLPQSAVGIPTAIVADIREDERLLKEVLREVIMCVEETAREMVLVYNILNKEPIPNQTKLLDHLFKANIALDNAWTVGHTIQNRLNSVIKNQLVFNNHAHDASVAAVKAHDALIRQNDRMFEADRIVRDFFDNSSKFGDTWLRKLEQSKKMTSLAVKAVNNTHIMLQELNESVNIMIDRQRQPTRVWGGPSIAMGVPVSQVPASQ